MILVTGATGQSGVPMVKALAKRGAKFKVLVRDPAKAAGVRVKGAEVVTGDLGDVASLSNAFSGVTALLLNSGPGPEIARLQSGALDAAKKSGVKHVVKFSAQGAGPNAATRF